MWLVNKLVFTFYAPINSKVIVSIDNSNNNDDRRTDKIEKTLFLDSGNHGTQTFIIQYECQISHKFNTFSHAIRI